MDGVHCSDLDKGLVAGEGYAEKTHLVACRGADTRVAAAKRQCCSMIAIVTS